MKKILLLAPLILSACMVTIKEVTPISEIMDRWRGASEAKLLQSFGPPTTSTTDGKNGKILNYESKRNVGMVFRDYLGTEWYSKDVITYMQFYVSPDSGVYFWRTNLPNITRTKRVRWKDTPEGKATKEYERTHTIPQQYN